VTRAGARGEDHGGASLASSDILWLTIIAFVLAVLAIFGLTPQAGGCNDTANRVLPILRMRSEHDDHWNGDPRPTIVQQRHEPEGSGRKRRRGGRKSTSKTRSPGMSR
jgi:hypothetical protein